MHSEKECGKQLIQSVLQGESDNAIYWTCMCLRGNQMYMLEDAWIELSARIGARHAMPFRDTWLYINHALLKIIRDDDIHVADAVQMTGMLFMLYHRQDTLTKPEHFSKLRKEILEYFPDGALLSFRGQQQFSRILPPVGSATHAFVHRVLAGLSRLIEKEDTMNVHRALEYISRKKLQIPMPNVWPAPSLELSDKGDPVWFLWGSMLLFFPQNENVAALWELYQHNWRASVKSGRAGLLWGVAHLMQTGVGSLWSKEEIAVLEKARLLAPDLWASIQEVEGRPEDDLPEHDVALMHETHTSQRLQILDAFLPRVDPRDAAYQKGHAHMESSMPLPNKILHIHPKNSDLGTTTPPHRLGGQPSSNKKNETHRDDSRYRWLHFGSEGS